MKSLKSKLFENSLLSKEEVFSIKAGSDRRTKEESTATGAKSKDNTNECCGYDTEIVECPETC